METTACREKLNALLNKRCWGVVVGAPSAQIVHMHFGEKVERDKPIKNPTLPPDLRSHYGEFTLAIYCHWRLQENSRPITGSCESNEDEGILVKSIKGLVGESVSQVELIDECGDIAIHFGTKTLKVFCVYTGNEDEDYWPQWHTNWYICHRMDPVVEVIQGCQIVLPD